MHRSACKSTIFFLSLTINKEIKNYTKLSGMHQVRWSRKFQTFDSVNCTMSWDAGDVSV